MNPHASLPILYSFRRCPYAMRARMAIRQAGQVVQLREVVLGNKPAALIEASPKATVPVLVLPDETVIDESLAIMHWALSEADPEHWLPMDAAGSERTARLIEHNDHQFKPWLDRYKYADRYPEQPAVAYRREAEGFIRELESVLGSQATLHGTTLGLADAAIFPFVRQFAHVDRDWFLGAAYPAVQAWYRDWIDSPLFTTVMSKPAPWEPDQAITLFPAATESAITSHQA